MSRSTLDLTDLGLSSMTASGCAPCAELARQQTSNPDNLADASPLDQAAPGNGAPAEHAAPAAWSGVIGMEGELTGDGRLIEANALRWEGLPIPLRYVPSDVGAHDGAVVVGRITEITRADGGRIEAAGDFDMSSPMGIEAQRQVAEGLTTGVSMDLDDVSFEIRVAQDVLDDGFGFPLFLAAEGEGDDAGSESGDVDGDGRVTIMEVSADDEVRVTTSGRIRAATIVAIPAFASAQIHAAEVTSETPPGEAAAAVVTSMVAAAGVPVDPPAAWFENPNFTGPEPIHVTADGRIYGHMATWGSCHIGFGEGAGQCTLAPHSATNYRHFHLGALLTAEGNEIAVGHITMDTGHAGGRLSPVATLAHYDNTASVAAHVRVGEDSHGVWVAGAVRPSVMRDAEKVRALRSAPLSGDWRRIGGNLEMVAALCCNTPGYGVPRPQGLVASGQIQSLVAAGIVPPRTVIAPGEEGALSLDDLRYLKRLAARERAEEAALVASGRLDTATELARRVRASALRMRVNSSRGH